MEKLKGLLKTWSDNVTNVVRTEIKGIPQPIIKNDALVAKIADIEKGLSKKLDSISPQTEALIKKAVENINQNQRKEVNIIERCVLLKICVETQFFHCVF